MRIVATLGFVVPLIVVACADPETRGSAQAQGTQVPIAAARQSPDAIASALVDVALPVDWAGPFKNLLSTGEGEGKDAWLQFLAALRKAAPTADFQDNLRLAQTVVHVRPLFKAGALQAPVATLYKNRLEAITPAHIARWKAALQARCKLDDLARDWRVALEMLQIDSLWSAQTLGEQSNTRSMGRLESIPPGKMDEWRAEGCVDLLRVEGLFVSDRFDVSLFDRALPLAKQKYEARSAEQATKQ